MNMADTSTSHCEVASEDEWEYEYAEDETEDFYICLDLAHVPSYQQKKQSTNFRLGPDEPSLGSGSTGKAADGLSGDGTDGGTDSNSEGLQILDLHGSNPVVSYQGRVYSCKWASSIGTDLYFAKKNEEAERRCLRSFENFEMLGLGASRLIASNTQLKAKRIHFEPRNSLPGNEEAEGQLNRPEKILKIDIPDSADPVRRNQANFLERLSQAKAQRNEKDKVPVTAIRSMKPFGSAD